MKRILKKIYHTGGLLVNSATYDGPTFYAERKQYSIWTRRWRQLKEIWEHGDKEFYFMLYGMDVKSASECKGYVNTYEFTERRNYLNYGGHDHSSSIILRDKFYFGIFADAIGVATPPNYAYLDTEGRLFSIKKREFVDMETILHDGDHDFFCKNMTGECAEGMMRVKVKNGVLLCQGEEVSIDDFCQLTKGTSYLLQERISQHPAMAAMHPDSINTIRLITVRSLKDCQLHVWPSHMRTGRGGSEVDNTAAGGVGIGVDYGKDGLKKLGVIKTEHRFVTEHPDTHIKFSEFKIPFLQEAVEQAIFFHSMLPDLHSIGWDICMTEKGPLFIEGNDNWEITTCQACHGGLEKLYNEYFYGK